jgi:hypothetical protein
MQANAASMYEAMRRRAQQTAGNQGRDEQEAIQRRFAQGGRANAGSFNKIAAKATDANAQRETNAVADVNQQEQAYQLAMSQQQGQQDFQRAERLGSEQFAKGLANQEMNFKKDVFAKEFSESQFANMVNASTALKNSGFSQYQGNSWLNFLKGFRQNNGQATNFQYSPDWDQLQVSPLLGGGLDTVNY